jgi:hypothetical protein
MNEELKTLLSRPTASVPEVGRICFGLSPKGSYDAAKRGDIPTVKVGGGDERPRLKVPTARLRPMLGLESVS